MGYFSAEERELFESEAIGLYETIVTEGGIAAVDDRITEGGSLRTPFDLLVRMSLVHLDTEAGRWLAADPAAAQAQVVSPMALEGARLLDESSQWHRTFAAVGQTWRDAAADADRGPFVYVRGPAIGPYLDALVAECEQELITAQPQTGRETGEAYTVEMTSSERDLLARGVRLVTLYQHSARRSAATRDYATAISELGGEVRTLDEFFNRMIVIDRRVAVIPAPDDLSVAMAIREPTVVAYLVDVFLRSWERGRPFDSTSDKAKRDIAKEQRAMTMRMMIEGYADPVSAKRLGVSARTYAGYVSDLKEEFSAETRFQLGYAIGSQGITPADLPDGSDRDL